MSTTKLRILLLSDVDLSSAAKLVEWVLGVDSGDDSSDNGVIHHSNPNHGATSWDLCCVLGPFTRTNLKNDPNYEGRAADEGEMTAIIAQLENIVCRVVYTPGSSDPVMPAFHRTFGPPHLTGTSQNLNQNCLRLAPGLCIAAYTEPPDSNDIESLSITKAICTSRPDKSHTSIIRNIEIESNERLILLSCLHPGNDSDSFPYIKRALWFQELWEWPEFNSNVVLHVCSHHRSRPVPNRPFMHKVVKVKSLREDNCFHIIDIERNIATNQWTLRQISEQII